MWASSFRALVSCALILLFVSAAFAQEKKSPEQAQKITSTTELVLVPVVVRDKSGAHVPGLAKDAFQVSEAGKAQDIAFFEEVKAATSPARRPLPSSGVYTNVLQQQDDSAKRIVVIALDQLNSAYVDQARAKQQLTEHLVDVVGDGSLTALVRIHSKGITVIHDFTSDPRILIAGMRAVLAAHKGEVSPTEFDSLNPIEPDAGGEEKSAMLKQLADPNANVDLREFMAAYKEWLVQKANYANQSAAIRATLEAMEHIAHALAGMPGRKSLIWLTGSFPLSLNPGSDILDGQGAEYFHRTLQALNDANVAVYPVDIRGVVNTEISGLDAGYRTQLVKQKELNATKPFIQAEDPAKLRMEAMRSFAASTGGLALLNSNEVQNGIKKAIDDSAAYYMLGYYRIEKTAKMQWRPLGVKVRGSGLQVRTRTGFYAGEANEKTTNAELVDAMDSPWDYTGVALSVRWDSAGTKKNGDGKKNVGFQIFVNPGAIDVSRRHLQVEYAAAVKELNGNIVTRWGQTLDGYLNEEQQKQIVSTGMSYRNALLLSPGKYLVRFVVRDDLTGRIGSVLAPLEVN